MAGLQLLPIPLDQAGGACGIRHQQTPEYQERIPRKSHVQVKGVLLLSAPERHDANTLSRSRAWARTPHGTPLLPNPEL